MRQPEILEYLNGVVDRYDLREHIALETAMTDASFDEVAGIWTVHTDRGVTFECRFLVNGLGLLSATNVPDFPGMNDFEGRLVHTGAWPEDLDLTGKRVGVIGNGSTGNQVITATAPIVGHLTSFQRTPQYSVPAGNRELSPAELQSHRDDFDRQLGSGPQLQRRDGFRGKHDRDVQRERRGARTHLRSAPGTKGGGFRFMFETFCDIATNEAANEEAASFIRRKIAEIVKDPGDPAQADAHRPATPADRCATPATTRPSTAPTSRW